MSKDCMLTNVCSGSRLLFYVKPSTNWCMIRFSVMPLLLIKLRGTTRSEFNSTGNHPWAHWKLDLAFQFLGTTQARFWADLRNFGESWRSLRRQSGKTKNEHTYEPWSPLSQRVRTTSEFHGFNWTFWKPIDHFWRPSEASKLLIWQTFNTFWKLPLPILRS